ncbi:MAG: serine acetyltransferase [Treponema sp.]|nr:serine acetyltransferase [Treponema sp.]
MDMDKRKIIQKISTNLLEQHHDFAAFPGTENIIGIINKIRAAIYPEYFIESLESKPLALWLQSLLEDIYTGLRDEIKTALLKRGGIGGAARLADKVSMGLLEHLAGIKRMLKKDAEAGFKGDPAAQSIGEVILTYPGFFAVFVYRIAHFIFSQGIPLIPRIMSEHAHSVTGIDIHPGAAIGEYFFIDHGTGVVIGETTVIGNHVKLYQGVTLGALSTKSGQKLAGKKRHPTIEDNVTIYSGATILGGETIIGKNSTIGGNVFIVESIHQNTTVKGAKQKGK